MKCNFKNPKGDKCGLPSLNKKDFCCIHDPNSVSVYFVKDFKNYKRGEVLYGISKEEGASYLKEGVALIVDKLLLKRINFNSKS